MGCRWGGSSVRVSIWGTPSPQPPFSGPAHAGSEECSSPHLPFPRRLPGPHFLPGSAWGPGPHALDGCLCSAKAQSLRWWENFHKKVRICRSFSRASPDVAEKSHRTVWRPLGVVTHRSGQGAYFLSWAGPGASGKEATVGSRDQSPYPSPGPPEDHFQRAFPAPTVLSLGWVEPLVMVPLSLCPPTCEFGDRGLHLPPTSVILALNLPLAVNIFTPVRDKNIKKFSSEV